MYEYEYDYECRCSPSSLVRPVGGLGWGESGVGFLTELVVDGRKGSVAGIDQFIGWYTSQRMHSRCDS